MILVIEDEPSLNDLICLKLKNNNYKVESSLDGDEGIYKALSDIYDLIILDVMLPNTNGFDILKELQKNKIKSKVIMLTARSTIEDKLKGLKGGANDYLTKPFHMDELLARVNILVNKDKIGLITYGNIELDTANSILKCKTTGEKVELVCKELSLLEYFINNKEQVLTKEQIYNRIWGLENDIESNNLEVYLSFIRRKLKAIGANVNIKSLRGIGYRLVKNE